MVSGSSSVLPSAQSRKCKWNSANVTRINIGDSDSEDISTAVIQQATWDGRRVERTFHSIPMPRDPQAVAEPHSYVIDGDMDFGLDAVGEDVLDGDDDADGSGYVGSQLLPRAWIVTNKTTG